MSLPTPGEQPTEPLAPYPGPPAPSYPGATPPRRRRRGLTAAIVALVLLVVIGGILVVADIVVRGMVQDEIETQLTEALVVERGSPLAVEVGGVSILAQLAVGRLDRIEVTGDSVMFGEITGAIDAVATGVPTDQSEPVEALDIRYSIPSDELGNLSANLSGLPISSVEIDGDAIRIAADISVFGIPIPIGVGIDPGAENGQLTFTPSSISLSEATVTTAELRRVVGSAADDLLQTREFCVAQYLPSAFTLEGVGIRGRELVLTLEARDAILSEDALATPGTC